MLGVTDADPDTTTAGQILKPTPPLWLCLGPRFQGQRLAADLPAPFVIGRTPLADMLDVAVATGAHLALIQPTYADTR